MLKLNQVDQVEVLHQERNRKLLELLKNKIFKVFVTSFLKLLGKKSPEFVLEIIKDLSVSERQEKVLIERYINGTKFDLIPEIVFCEERQVYKLHKQFIDSLVSYVISYKPRQ